MVTRVALMRGLPTRWPSVVNITPLSIAANNRAINNASSIAFPSLHGSAIAIDR